ncbi:MAG TPA: hypothetical protein VMF08_03520 [Candidatus Sulfotelmatobacter sp.]|nr:hypothetical protein [Candidatus Sulfotelmatobacter sp.]
MKRKALDKLVRDPKFISGIYNYCDRWCERCPLSHRCLVYATERADEDADASERDLANQKFWDRLHRRFRETLEMVQADAKERGIDLDDPKLQTAVALQQREERRRETKNLPLARVAKAYIGATDQWFDQAKPLLEAKVGELKTQLKLEIGDPAGDAEKLSDFTDVVRWYQHFIYVKLRRAIGSRASEELETDEELKRFPKDSDGSAKIVLIAIDRSIAAWSGLREALGGDDGDSVLDLLAQLAQIRRETEKLFPQARSFVRPGFDAPARANRRGRPVPRKSK